MAAGREVAGESGAVRGLRAFHQREASAWKETYSYSYHLKSGEVQQRLATISVSEMEWRWRWFGRKGWCKLLNFPWPRLVRRYLDVEFEKEIGERTGSWKGGTVGCSYSLRKWETPFECLKRMERERKF